AYSRNRGKGERHDPPVMTGGEGPRVVPAVPTWMNVRPVPVAGPRRAPSTTGGSHRLRISSVPEVVVMKGNSQAGAGEVPRRPLGKTGEKVSILGVGGHHLGDFATL